MGFRDVDGKVVGRTIAAADSLQAFGLLPSSDGLFLVFNSLSRASRSPVSDEENWL